MHGHKRRTKTGRKGRNWFCNSSFCPCNFGGVSRNKMIGGLVCCQFRNRRQHSKSITGQEKDVLWVACHRRYLNVVDVVDWIAYAGILGATAVKIINGSIFFENHIFQKGAWFDCFVNIGLIVGSQINHFGITASFKIKNGVVCCPPVFIVSNQFAMRIRRQRCFSGSRQAKKDGRITCFANTCRTVHRQDIVL